MSLARALIESAGPQEFGCPAHAAASPIRTNFQSCPAYFAPSRAARPSLNGVEVRLSISAGKPDHVGLEDTLSFLVYSGPHGEVGCWLKSEIERYSGIQRAG